MDFMSMVNETINGNKKAQANLQRTENGALGLRTTGTALLDLNFKLSSYRNMSTSTIVEDFMKAWKEDKNLALKYLFYARDILEGAGERRFFRTIFKHLADSGKFPAELVSKVPEHGRYDDLFILFDTALEPVMVKLVKDTLTQDMVNVKAGKSISLLAKWMPSINTSSVNTVAMAQRWAKILGLTPRMYRKTLARLRAVIDVTEVKMSSRDWDKIDYSRVPSKANANYKDAFLKHDFERRTAFLGKAVTGEVKVNAKTLAPHEIVHKYGRNSRSIDTSLEVLWKNLPTNFKMDGSTMVVADGSGSMTSTINGTNVSALSVANALAIYFAERAKGPYANKYITFSSRPQYVDFSKCNTLRDKLYEAHKHNEVSNTNLEAVFDLILQTAVSNKLKQSDLPSQILVISDMEFDSSTSGSSGWWGGDSFRGMSRTLMQEIANKYARYGYKLPKLIFWNVMSRTGTIPVKDNEYDVSLVSGFSPNTMKMVMANETDPYVQLVKLLNTKRYEAIHY